MVAISTKFILVVCLSVLTCATALAQRNNLQPKDFEPLTSLPWVDNEKATLEQVIDRIFREPNMDVRYPVLGAYLRQLPVKDLRPAFDQAVAREGTQTPNALVYFLLYIWAERDPSTAWEKTRDLFEVVGIEDGWLSFDSWENDPIVVQNRAAIEKSPFWLDRYTLMGLVEGLDDSGAQESGQLRMMKAFADLWFERFKCWPDSRANRWRHYPGRTTDSFDAVIAAFTGKPSVEMSPSYSAGSSQESRTVHEVQFRRWLKAHPDGMNKLLDAGVHISPELLVIWHHVNAPALQAWALEAHPEEPLLDVARNVRCMIMPEVSAAQRKTWISQMLHGDVDNICRLASWWPQLAMESAVLVEDDLELAHLVDSCAYGPWDTQAWNTTHSGFGYLKEHRLEHLPESLRKKLLEGWYSCTFMELWGDLDIGEAARFGLNLLLTDLKASREDLLTTLRGSDPPQSDDGIWDRTFCALRVWAVVRPTEMKKWIATQEGEDLRSALTWLLEHPWGGDKAKP